MKISSQYNNILYYEIKRHMRKPAYWGLIMFLILPVVFHYMPGIIRIQANDWWAPMNSYAAVLKFFGSMNETLSLLLFLFWGRIFIEDEDHRTKELLLSYPLSNETYVWGKFSAALAATLIAFGIQTLLLFASQFLPSHDKVFILPWDAVNHLKSFVLLAIPSSIYSVALVVFFSAFFKKTVPSIMGLVFYWLVETKIISPNFLWDPLGYKSLSLLLEPYMILRDVSGFALTGNYYLGRLGTIIIGLFLVWLVTRLTRLKPLRI